MSDSSFYNTWRNNWLIERREREREREGNISGSSFYNTWRNNWLIERREGGKHE